MARRYQTGGVGVASAALCYLASGLVSACSSPNAQPHVEYEETSTLAAFQSSPNPAGTNPGSQPQGTASTAPTTMMNGGASGVSGGSTAGMGSSSVKPMSGTGGGMAVAVGTGGMQATMGLGGAGASTAGTSSTPTAGTGSTGEGTGQVSKLSFEYSTVSYRGRYAPKNVGAVWVEDTSGKWIYTLEFWGSSPNDSHLTRYGKTAGASHDYALSNPVTALFGGSKYVVMPPPDVISGPTLNMHKAHSVTWSLKDSQGAVVPDGQYRVVIEITEDDHLSEKSQEVPFTKGAPATVMQPDSAVFTGMKLTLQ